MSLYVNYTIMEKDYQAGPYNQQEADDHKRDIQSFAGVSKCYLSAVRDPKRLIVSETADV